MSIEFHCTSCNKLLRVPNESAGRKAQCPSCEEILDIPAAPVPGSGVRGESPFAAPAASVPAEESGNPFQSPLADDTGQPASWLARKGEIVPTRMHFDLLARTWEIFRSQLGTFLLEGLAFIGMIIAIYLVMGVVMFGLMGVSGGFDDGQPAGSIVLVATVMILLYVVMLVAMCWIYLGVAVFNLKLARGEPADFGVIFSGGRFLLRGIGIGFILAIVNYSLLAICMVPFIVMNEPGWQVVGQIVATIISWAIMFLTVPAFFLLVDRDFGVFESIKTSINLMAPNIPVSFGIWLVTMILGGLGTLMTCGLGYIAFIPFIVLLFTTMYLEVSGQMPTASGSP